MSAITIGGDLIHYEVLGRGRPVLLVHGWVGCWRYWVPTMQQLLLKYRVYALDMYGFGDTGKNPQKYTLDHQVQLLNDFMNSMAIPKAAFIGHGLGALAVSEFARLNADKAPRIMLVSTPLFDPGNLDKRVAAARPSVPLTHNRPLNPTPAVPAPSASAPAASAPAATATTTASPSPAQSPASEPDSTIMNASSAMRAALLERQRAQATSSTTNNNSGSGSTVSSSPAAPAAPEPNQPKHNPLQASIANTSPDALLGKCFKRTESAYEKLAADLTKTDVAAIKGSVNTYDSGRMLDTLRMLTMPRVLVNGLDDSVVAPPSETVWNYLTNEREETLLPILLPGVRHFPMLEYERFSRLVNDFLEVPDISKLEIKERWKRRTR
jgi:pimeloyl-ACP methyl ester carboxylesterase